MKLNTALNFLLALDMSHGRLHGQQSEEAIKENPGNIRKLTDMGPLYFSESSYCYGGYRRADNTGLNGDLNQSAGGKDIYLCLANDFEAQGVTSLKLVQNKRSCGSDYNLARHVSSLNGDLNQGAGGKDIYLCYSSSPSQGSPITTINIREHRPPNDLLPLLPDGLNGDLNQSAGGKDIFFVIYRKGGSVSMGPLYLSEDSSCYKGYTRALSSAGLNGDLNQGAGGKDIFLCLANDFHNQGVTGLKLVQSSSCGYGWSRVNQVSSLNGDLNQGAGGKDIYLCYSSVSSEGSPIVNVYIREQWPLAAKMPLRPDGLNGDLNQSAGGKDIFIEIYRKDANNALPGENSMPAMTNYHFGGYPGPGYLPVEICGGLFIEFSCKNVGPCWHAQQLVTFADADYLYTFFTMSQSRHGKAYLLKAPLTKNPSASWPAVPLDGTVNWYEETTNFNHPGDLVIKDRIILTANQNWDPTNDWQDFGCGFIEGVTLGGGGCNCFSDLASNKQALTIWDFSQSIHSPQRHNVDKWAFNSIINGEMDDSDADNLWGGDVDGELIINFEGYWLHYKGGTIGSVDNWEEVTNVSIPSCSGEMGSGAGKLFAKINGKSYLAYFEVDEPCYTLRPVTYDTTGKTLTVDCVGMLKQCTPGGQLVDSNDRKRAFQTITEGPDGRVYITALNIYGTATQVMVSDA